MSDGSPSHRSTVALAGCGAVGGALVELLFSRLRRDPTLRRRVRLEQILVRDPLKRRPECVATVPLGTDLDRFLATQAEVVVEAVGGVEPALSIARSALDRGAAFVTANKALVALHGAELRARAESTGGRLLFEGAVGGGVPVLRTLRSSFHGVPVRGVRGILNGTCNFVLSEMEEGRSFQAALGAARALGYAEADATRDVDGRDAADKIAILAWLCWGVDPATVETRVQGLLPDPDALVAEAIGAGLRVRLLAECRLENGTLESCVRPVSVTPESGFGRTVGVDNRIRIDTGDAGSYVMSGPGAGGVATASAVLSDLLEALPSASGRLRVAPTAAPFPPATNATGHGPSGRRSP